MSDKKHHESGETQRWQATCPQCGATFTDRDAFRQHARDEHGSGTGNENTPCPRCGGTGVVESNSGNNTVTCPRCHGNG